MQDDVEPRVDVQVAVLQRPREGEDERDVVVHCRGAGSGVAGSRDGRGARGGEKWVGWNATG